MASAAVSSAASSAASSMASFMDIGTIHVLLMIVLTVTYLGGQVKQKRYKEWDVIYLICMLTFSLFSFFGIKFAPTMNIQVGITAFSAVAMLIANFVGYNIKS
jgi:hypothetical protein